MISTNLGAVMIPTMIAAVFLDNARRYAHAIAGLAALPCGPVIEFQGP